MSEILDRLTEAMQTAQNSIAKLSEYREELQAREFQQTSDRYAAMMEWVRSLENILQITFVSGIIIDDFSFCAYGSFFCSWRMYPNYNENCKTARDIMRDAIKIFETRRSEIEERFANILIQKIIDHAESINTDIDTLKKALGMEE